MSVLEKYTKEEIKATLSGLASAFIAAGATEIETLLASFTEGTVSSDDINAAIHHARYENV